MRFFSAIVFISMTILGAAGNLDQSMNDLKSVLKKEITRVSVGGKVDPAEVFVRLESIEESLPRLTEEEVLKLLQEMERAQKQLDNARPEDRAELTLRARLVTRGVIHELRMLHE